MHKNNWSRRVALTAGLIGAAVAITGCASPASSGGDDDDINYPDGPLSYVIPYNPGGSADPVGREFSKLLGEELGVSAIVENLPGADEMIGVSSVVEADPDGQRIAMTSAAGIVFGPLVTPDLSYHGIEDYTPLVKMVSSPNAIFVAADGGYESLDDFIDAAKADPGGVTIATIGRFTIPTFNLLILEKEAGIDLNIVPYSGGAGEAMLAVLGGEIDAAVSAASGQLGLVEAGDLRAIAHTGDSSYDAVLPGAVSFESAGLDIPFSVEYLNVAPAGLDDAVREKLTAAAYAVASSDEWAAWCEDNGLQAVPMQGDELEDWIADITETSKEAIKLVEKSGL